MRNRLSSVPESDPGFAEVVRGHLYIDAVTHTDADEVLSHLSGDMGQDFVSVGKGHAKHGARQHLRNRAR